MPDYTYHPDLALCAYEVHALAVVRAPVPWADEALIRRAAKRRREYHPIKNAMHGYDIAVNSEFLRPVMAYRIEFLRKVFTGR